MHWLDKYQLFLFDFDGLLVNTEEIHYLAYQRMCQQRGHELSWNFATYCQAAHYSQEKLQASLFQALPSLAKEESWEVLYQEKKEAVVELLKEGAVHLMPGAKELLEKLNRRGVARCVVTHSPREYIDLIREQHPILDTIPAWFTRETYSQPKPHPECYLNAIEKLGKKGKEIVGFEDTPRGVKALIQTPAKAIFVSEISYPETVDFLELGVEHFPSLYAVLYPNNLKNRFPT